MSAAFSLASVAHAGQVRKGSNVPYLAHLLGVTELVMMYGGTDTEAAAALLHDAVEDGGGISRLGDIRAACGERVAAIVESCSDSTVDTTAGAEKATWKQRKERYIAHLASPDVPEGAALVSACNKLHNLRATRLDYEHVGKELWERFKTGADGQLWYYRQLLDVYRRSPDARVRTVAESIASELHQLEIALSRG